VSGTGFTYDAAGNLTSDGTNNYVYDADGNISQQGTTPYIYDALNHQVGQTFSSTSSTAVAFDKDGNLASLWLVSNGNTLGSSALIGKAYWNRTAFESHNNNSSTVFFEHRDWVDSRRASTNTAKAVTYVRTSLPFGDGASNISGSRDNTYDGYTGLWEWRQRSEQPCAVPRLLERGRTLAAT
jgi:hypothetical protein